MRSPAAGFDLSAALEKEIRGALAALSERTLDARSIHAARVHLKRARALARVGAEAAPGLADVFNGTARAAMHALSAARDLDAMAACAKAAAKGERRKKRAAALAEVARSLAAQRAAIAPVKLEAARKGLTDLLALARVWPQASPRQIARGAARVAARARKAQKRGEGSRNALRRHAWRKREKDRFFAAELLAQAWPRKLRRRAGRAELLGNALGRERDTLLLISRIEAEPSLAGGMPAAFRALEVLHAKKKKLAARSDALGDKLHRGGA